MSDKNPQPRPLPRPENPPKPREREIFENDLPDRGGTRGGDRVPTKPPKR